MSDSESAAETQPSPNSAAANDRRLLVIPLTAVIITGVIVSLICALTVGGSGLVSAVLGTLVVAAFFGIAQFIVARVLRNNPALAMNVALLVYVLQMAVLMGLMLLLRNASFLAPKAFAAAILACALAWTAAAVWAQLSAKVLYVEPGTAPDGFTVPGEPPTD